MYPEATLERCLNTGCLCEYAPPKTNHEQRYIHLFDRQRADEASAGDGARAEAAKNPRRSEGIAPGLDQKRKRPSPCWAARC
jgi:hypothetical protein